MDMLIEIGKDVVARAYEGDELALDVLKDLAVAFKKCFHIIFTDRSSLLIIQKIDGLNKDDKKVYELVGLKLASNKGFYDSFGFHAYITFEKNTSMSSDMVIVNPLEIPSFEWFSRTKLVTENLMDADFYDFVVAYYMRKSKIRGFKSESDNIPGGGDTTVQYCDKQIKAKKNFCLIIVDSDLRYKGGSLKETSGKVKSSIDKAMPFNCNYYVIEKLSEIENMIPFPIIASFPCYKNNQIIRDKLQFCHDYFDFKKGLWTNEIVNNDFYRYWYEKLCHIQSVIDIVEEYREEAVKCGGKREDFEKLKHRLLIEGFGDKLLGTIMKNDEAIALLRKVEDADLSPEQRNVWSGMGQMIFEWCCAFRNYKNT